MDRMHKASNRFFRAAPFISPHRDDAVLSRVGATSALVRKGIEVLHATVTRSAAAPDATPSALGVACIRLDFPDAALRSADFTNPSQLFAQQKANFAIRSYTTNAGWFRQPVERFWTC